MTTIKVRWDPHPPREMARRQKYLTAGHFDIRGQISEIRLLMPLSNSLPLFTSFAFVSVVLDIAGPTNYQSSIIHACPPREVDMGRRG